MNLPAQVFKFETLFADQRVMEKGFLSFILILFFWSGELQANSYTLESDSWVVYKVQTSHSLWKFSESLGVKLNDIPIFIREIMETNPRLNDPDKIKPGDHIIFKVATLDLFVPQKKSDLPLEELAQERDPASVQQVQYKAEGAHLVSLRPRLAFSRIDATQRGTGARARLLSTINFGLKGSYSWNNSWGPGEISLDSSFAEYDEELGQAIGRNEVFLNQLEYIQGFKLTHSWSTLVHLGVMQSPYLFTDSNSQLILKVGTQPGLGLSAQKMFYSLQLTLNAHGQYLMRSYAGDTVVDEGYSYGLSAFKKWKLWDQSFEFSIHGDQRKLLSEVTSQTLTEISLGLGFSF